MLGDDFAAYRAIAPSCFVQVGMLAPEKNCCYAHHHGMFKVDEDVLPLCVAWMAANAERAARSLFFHSFVEKAPRFSRLTARRL